jgi:hypothetical protein
LDNTMQLPKDHAGWHQNPPPGHRADAQQPDLELQDLRRLGRIRGLGSGWGALWLMKVSRSLVSSGWKRCETNPLPNCPTEPHALLNGPAKSWDMLSICPGCVPTSPDRLQFSHRISQGEGTAIDPLFRLTGKFTKSFSGLRPTPLARSLV